MLYFKEDQRCMVWDVEDKENYSLVRMSSSRKDKRSGEYVYSDWSFVKFVKDAYTKSLEVEPKTIIVLKGSGISNESYMKDGVKTWPKKPPMVVFNFELFEGDGEGEEKPKSKISSKPKAKKPKLDEPPQIEDEPEEEGLPF